MNECYFGEDLIYDTQTAPFLLSIFPAKGSIDARASTHGFILNLQETTLETRLECNDLVTNSWGESWDTSHESQSRTTEPQLKRKKLVRN